MNHPLPHAKMRAEAREHFANARQDTVVLMRSAMASPGMSALQIAHARAIEQLAGLSLFSVVGVPIPEDALHMRDDIEAFGKIVDALIDAMGAHATESLPYIVRETFMERGQFAIEEPVAVLSAAAEKMNAERYEDR